MQCGVCERTSSRLQCASCAKQTLWHSRFQILVAVSERDAASDKVQETLDTSGDALATRVRIQEVRDRLAQIAEAKAERTAQLDQERERLEAVRKERDARLRRKEIAEELERRHKKLAATVQAQERRLDQKWQTVAVRTAEARNFLCREGAQLYGLRKELDSKSGRLELMIGRVAVPNFLKDLNAYPHTHISTAIAHLCHLVAMFSIYLGLKLPYEILLPAAERPLPFIRGLVNDKHDKLGLRPLHLTASVSELGRDDPVAQSKFFDGAAMFAMDVMWLCYSQGLEITDLDQVCNPGMNLWRLVNTERNPKFGRASHVTLRVSLAKMPGAEMMSKATKVRYRDVVERIKTAVVGDALASDWDLVPERPEMERSGGPAGGEGTWTRIKARSGPSET